MKRSNFFCLIHTKLKEIGGGGRFFFLIKRRGVQNGSDSVAGQWRAAAPDSHRTMHIPGLTGNQELCGVQSTGSLEIQALALPPPWPGHKAGENGHQRSLPTMMQKAGSFCFKSWLNMVIFFLTAWIFGDVWGKRIYWSRIQKEVEIILWNLINP